MNQDRQTRRALFVLAVVVASLALTACGTRHVSRGISADGKAGEVVFPEASNAVLKDGIFPNIENLRAVGAGISKDQLSYLLGRPHFREGFSGVREWDYLFHFRRDKKLLTCQYKVIFDQEYRGQSFHWSPASCANILDQAPSPTTISPTSEKMSLSTDTLFVFGRSGVEDILPNGREELERLAKQVGGMSAANVRVVGHTDRIGDDTANQILSEQRASAVRQVLIDEGVEASLIMAAGHGEREPVKTCEDQGRDALIACLAPNRRVEIVVDSVQ